MKIEVLGPGCAKCEALYARVQTVTSRLGLECELVKVSDITEIISRGVMTTPALVIDGEVKIVGKLPSEADLESLVSAG